MAKILLADDDNAFGLNVAEWLKASDYKCDLSLSAEDTSALLKKFDYDLILLDWEFPDGGGIEIISSFRKGGGLTPILMLTGKTAVEDKERGLDAGADDYLTKPFHMKELGARMRALLRRPPIIASEKLKYGTLMLDTEKRCAYFNEEEVKLQPMEFLVLEFFLRNPGRPYSPEKIIERVWDTSTDVSLHAVYSCIKRLRKKLDRPGIDSAFQTVPGLGYELVLR